MKLLSLALLPFLIACGQQSDKITVIVSWAFGGSSSQVAQALQTPLSNIFNKEVELLHLPGGEMGLTGAAAVWDRPHNGTTFLAGAVQLPELRHRAGLTHYGMDDFRSWILWQNTVILAVSKNSKYKTLHDLLSGIEKGLAVSANSGTASMGYIAGNLLAKQLAIGNLATKEYDGGALAVESVILEEADYVMQGTDEIIDYVRQDELIPLGAFSEFNINYAGVDVQSIAKYTGNIKLVVTSSFGLSIPNDAPIQIIQAVTEAWEKLDLKELAEIEGRLYTPIHNSNKVRTVIEKELSLTK